MQERLVAEPKVRLDVVGGSGNQSGNPMMVGYWAPLTERVALGEEAKMAWMIYDCLGVYLRLVSAGQG